MSASLSTYGIIGVIILLAGWLLYRAALPKPIPGIPYNKEATRNIIGDVPTFMKWYSKRPEIYAWLSSQCVKLNSPVIQVFMRPFGKPWVIVTDFREAQDIMAKRTREFDRSNFLGDLFRGILPVHHVHMPTGDEWKAHRKLMGDTMSPSFLHDLVAPQLYNTALDTITFWKQKTRLAEGRPFPVLDDITRGALDVIWSAAFGSEVGTTRAQIDLLSKLDSIDLPKNVDSPLEFPAASDPAAFDAITTLTHSVEIAMNSPFPRQHHWLAMKTYPSLRSAKKHKDQLIQDSLDETWKKFSQGSEKEVKVQSALDLVVQKEVTMAKKEGRPPQYDTPAIKDELFGFIVAGHDTTAITTSWGVKLLTDNQQVQDKLRSALRTQYKRAAEEGGNPTVQDIVNAEIPYLEATIEEISRCALTAPGNIRRALFDTQVLGYHIPKGTDVFLVSSEMSQPSACTDMR